MEANVGAVGQSVRPPIPHLFSLGQRHENRGAGYSPCPILVTSPVSFSSVPSSEAGGSSPSAGGGKVSNAGRATDAEIVKKVECLWSGIRAYGMVVLMVIGEW